MLSITAPAIPLAKTASTSLRRCRGVYGQQLSYPVPFERAHLLIMTPERLDACTRHWRSHWRWLPEVRLLVVDELRRLEFEMPTSAFQERTIKPLSAQIVRQCITLSSSNIARMMSRKKSSCRSRSRLWSGRTRKRIIPRGASPALTRWSWLVLRVFLLTPCLPATQRGQIQARDASKIPLDINLVSPDGIEPSTL
jgi:hypothetical protein